jgi:hypothetical protein
MGKTRRKYRTKRKSRKRSRGGVGTTAQAAALSQVFQGLTNRNEYSDLLSEVLSHQPVEDRDNVERKQRRTMAKRYLNERLRELQAANIEREKVITELLAKINGTVEPDLVKRILRQSRPSHPLQREIRERGQNMTEAIQEELDNINFVDRYNSQSLRNAIRQMYPHLDPNNLPPGILMPPHRQLAEPTRRYSSLLQ